MDSFLSGDNADLRAGDNANPRAGGDADFRGGDNDNRRHRQKGGGGGGDVVDAVRRVLARHLLPGAGVTVALSGGMDSSSLLDAAAAAVKDDNGRDLWRLSACHVNHHLSSRAEAWERFCRRLCLDAGVPLTIKSASPPDSGGGEEWARRQRLQAFATLPSAAILAAHHSGDQAETVLFRLLRGAGSLGMSAMRDCSALPHAKLAGGGAAKMVILRPWLDIPRARIAEYARARRLRWVEDEDNHNLTRRRNFIRLRALPVMAGGGFDCAALLPVAARRFTDGAALLAELAQLDDDAAAADCFGARGFRVAHFLAIGESRTRNWLHNRLRRRGGRFSERGMAEAARQIFNAASKASSSSSSRKPSLHLRFGGVALREWRGFLFWDDLPPPPPDYERIIKIDELMKDAGNVVNADNRRWRIPCPELGGVLVLSIVNDGGGIALATTGGGLNLRLRGGGEKINPAGRPRHRAADMLREAGLLPWRRLRLPFVYVGDTLAAIPGIAVDERFAAAKGEAGVSCRFEWL